MLKDASHENMLQSHQKNNFCTLNEERTWFQERKKTWTHQKTSQYAESTI